MKTRLDLKTAIFKKLVLLHTGASLVNLIILSPVFSNSQDAADGRANVCDSDVRAGWGGMHQS